MGRDFLPLKTLRARNLPAFLGPTRGRRICSDHSRQQNYERDTALAGAFWVQAGHVAVDVLGKWPVQRTPVSEIKPQLQILRTCRPTYIEAARLLWCTNTISFNDARTFKEFMSCCNSAQTQFMTRLHLDITLHSARRVGEWDSALTMANVKSLKGFKTLHISLKRSHLRCPPNESQTRFDTILRDLCTQRITRFKILPLENVTVVVENEAYSRSHEATHWSSSVQVDWAETIRSTILDPEGPMRWQEE